jgi:hypothetical protein
MTIEAMKQALYALTYIHAETSQEEDDLIEKAITALRTAIAEAEKQEPVAWQGVHDQTDLYYRKPPQAGVRPLYTTPPEAQKEHKQMNGKQSPAPWNTPATSVQEPVAWANINKHGDITHTNNKRMPWSKTPLYTTPLAAYPEFECPRCGHCCPQRQPLTDEEIRDFYGDNNNFDLTGPYVIAFARAIEAAHGIGEKK